MGYVLSVAVIVLLIGIQCSSRKSPELPESPTRGNIRISADASFRPIVDAEIATFTSVYKYAFITPTYLTEKDLITAFLKDSVKVVVTAWEPTEQQKEVLLSTQTIVRTVTVAYDAIALVLNKDNKDSLLTYQNVNDLFTGKLVDWKELNPESKLGKIVAVFDNENSTNIRYFKEEFKLPPQLPIACSPNGYPQMAAHNAKNPLRRAGFAVSKTSRLLTWLLQPSWSPQPWGLRWWPGRGKRWRADPPIPEWPTARRHRCVGSNG